MIKGLKITGIEELKSNTLRLSKGFVNELIPATNAGSLPITNEAKRLCRKKTGTTAASIHFENLKVQRFRVENGIAPADDQKHAIGLERGNPPHVIFPKNKQALYWEGAAHPVRKVNHPGNPAYPFMRPAFDTKTREAISEVRIVFATLIERVL